MKHGTSYLVCKEHIHEVKEFLAQFFEEENSKWNHDGWITFMVPGTGFKVSLMKGGDQEITQNMTFEINCESLEELEEQAKKFNTEVDSFMATETSHPYRYYYIEIYGPAGICKIEMNYIEEK